MPVFCHVQRKINIDSLSLCFSCKNAPLAQFFDAPKCNKKQCSRQLQCEVPCTGNVINSSLFINSSLSSLSSTSHAVCRGVQPQVGEGVAEGRGLGQGVGGGEGVRERGQGTFHPPCHVLHYHMVLRPKGTSHNQKIYSQLLLLIHSLETGSSESWTCRHGRSSSASRRSSSTTCRRG